MWFVAGVRPNETNIAICIFIVTSPNTTVNAQNQPVKEPCLLVIMDTIKVIDLAMPIPMNDKEQFRQ
jgi:hypothetical protein